MSREFRLKIRLGNDAMQTAHDVAEALRQVANRIDYVDNISAPGSRIYDDNGNTVGDWEVR